MITITHSYGFFSCCSVRLFYILDYFINNKYLPEKVDSSQQFHMYKNNTDKDITFDFFKNYDDISIDIEYEKSIFIEMNNFQFDEYKSIEYEYILPFVIKYFTPSDNIINIYNYMMNSYKINPDNCIAIYYRGTDKKNETTLDSYIEYYNKLNQILTEINNDNIQILIQTDESQFLDFMKDKCSNNNIVIISENSTSYNSTGIHNEKSSSENYLDIQNLLATFLIISKCKYIICSSCNSSVWITYYRENADNVFQNLNKSWV